MSRRGQYAFSIGSAVALVLLIAIGAIVVSQMTGTFAPANPENVSNSVESATRNITDESGTAFNLLSIGIIVGVAVLIIIFISASIAAFGGEFE